MRIILNQSSLISVWGEAMEHKKIRISVINSLDVINFCVPERNYFESDFLFVIQAGFKFFNKFCQLIVNPFCRVDLRGGGDISSNFSSGDGLSELMLIF